MNRVVTYLLLFYILLLLPLLVYSYGFVDSNLILSTHSVYTQFQPVIRSVIVYQREVSTILYISLLSGFFVLYVWILHVVGKTIRSLSTIITLLAVILPLLLLSYPAFSYDIFNYIATAKVAFQWNENPWIIMPVDIPNEPALAYTRAANKVALYGPSWIIITSLPYLFGKSSVFFSLISFKLLITACYIAMLALIWRRTKDIWRVSLFAFNPLILFESILGGHNDMFMMLFAVGSILLLDTSTSFRKLKAMIALLVSVLVKGATIILFPLFFFPRKTYIQYFVIAYMLMFLVFLITPFREELYPWYAVWFLSCAAFLPKKNYMLLHEFNIVLCFGLMLRHAPYIFMGYYEGIGPLLRISVTIFPILLFFIIRHRRIYHEVYTHIQVVRKRHI